MKKKDDTSEESDSESESISSYQDSYNSDVSLGLDELEEMQELKDENANTVTQPYPKYIPRDIENIKFRWNYLRVQKKYKKKRIDAVKLRKIIKQYLWDAVTKEENIILLTKTYYPQLYKAFDESQRKDQIIENLNHEITQLREKVTLLTDTLTEIQNKEKNVVILE